VHYALNREHLGWIEPGPIKEMQVNCNCHPMAATTAAFFLQPLFFLKKRRTSIW
jgi:hypothetical protein